MKKPVFLLAVLICVVFTSQAQRQGISGKVFWLSGNQMPSPSMNATPQQGVVREIFVYKTTTLHDAVQNGNFFSDLKTELIAKTFSDEEGSFKIKLPPGNYSVFVKERDGLFANSFDSENKINAVVVKPGKFSWITINIDYEAAY